MDNPVPGSASHPECAKHWPPQLKRLDFEKAEASSLNKHGRREEGKRGHRPVTPAAKPPHFLPRPGRRGRRRTGAVRPCPRLGTRARGHLRPALRRGPARARVGVASGKRGAPSRSLRPHSACSPGGVRALRPGTAVHDTHVLDRARQGPRRRTRAGAARAWRPSSRRVAGSLYLRDNAKAERLRRATLTHGAAMTAAAVSPARATGMRGSRWPAPSGTQPLAQTPCWPSRPTTSP